MLSTEHLVQLQAVAAELRGKQESALADQLQAIVDAHLAQRSAVAEAATRRKGTGKGPPKLAYAIELEPGGTWYAMGMADAYAIAEKRAAEIGITLPARTSMTSIISAKGIWYRNAETDNGTVGLTLRKAKPKEAEELARELQ